MFDFDNNFLQKHFKYLFLYKPNIIFWGLGIENELYIEFEKQKKITIKEFLNNHKRERYSVDYFKNYKKEIIVSGLQHIIDYSSEYILDIPILMNAHSFLKTDCNNNSKTLYTKNTEDNPKFNNVLLIDLLKNKSQYIKKSINQEWLFDGDTIEFTTINFFNAKLDNIVDELINSKTEFNKNIQDLQIELNLFTEYGKLSLMENNNPFSIYLTNLNNISMFNNGTLHYNVTLPSELDEFCKIKDMKKFIKDHKKAILIIQWFEPLLIAVYGSPDPFSLYENFPEKNKFSGSSQRCAVSRYISIGTYDTDTMIQGKILTTPVNELSCSKNDYWWYHKYYSFCAYNKLNEIGLDINFNKYINHGIELRFFDHIKNRYIYESYEFIILLMDVILENDDIYNFDNPIINKTWNNFVLKIIISGINAKLSNVEKKMYENILRIKINNVDNIVDIYYKIFQKLRKRYYKLLIIDNDYYIQPVGLFSSLTIKEKIINKSELINYGYKILDNINNDILDEKIELNLSNTNIANAKCCNLL